MNKVNFVNAEKYFDEIRKYENVVLFGCGGKGKQAISILEKRNIKITAACDNNVDLFGKKFMEGVYIENFERVRQNLSDFCVIITCTILHATDIYNEIKEKDENIPVYHLCNPFKVEDDLLAESEFAARKEEIIYGFDLLQDEESRRIYCDTIHWKLTGNMLPMQRYSLGNEIYSFFDEAIVRTNEKCTYVDIGAYTGDTIESFLLFTRGRYKKIIGIEADYGNYAALSKFVQYSRIKNIEAYNIALWSREEDKVFYTNSVNKEINYDSPNLFQSVDKIADNKTLAQMLDKQKKQVLHVRTLDDLLKDESPSIIKINALAADMDIILGGYRILQQYKPLLILEFGVKKEDVFTLIKNISTINSEYKFYMRRKKVFDDIKTVLYCV